MRRTSLVPVAVGLTVAALALTGCKSGSDGASGPTGSGSTASASTGSAATASSSPSTSSAGGSGGADNAAESIVAAASKNADSVKSSHITVTTVIGGKTTKLDGDVLYSPSHRIDLSVSAAGGVNLRERLVGNTMYIKLPGAGSGLNGAQWASLSLKEIAKAAGLDLSSTLNNSSPVQTVTLMEKAGNIKVVGNESVKGVPTQHLAGTVDLAKVYDTLDTSTKSTWKNLVQQAGVKNVAIDLWVNSAGIPIKTVEHYDSTLGKGVSTMYLTRLNEHVSITAPPKSQVRKLLG